MFIKYKQDGEIFCIRKDSIWSYYISKKGVIDIWISDTRFSIYLYEGNVELADKIMRDALVSSDYVVELPTMERIEEYFNGKNKDSESNK